MRINQTGNDHFACAIDHPGIGWHLGITHSHNFSPAHHQGANINNRPFHSVNAGVGEGYDFPGWLAG